MTETDQPDNAQSAEPIPDHILSEQQWMLHASTLLQRIADHLGELSRGETRIACSYCWQDFPREGKGSIHEHIAVCPDHPLAKAMAEIKALKVELQESYDDYERLRVSYDDRR